MSSFRRASLHASARPAAVAGWVHASAQRSVQHAATRKHIVFSPRLFSTSHIFRRMVARMLPSCASMGARPVASACIKPRVQESKERKRVAKMCTVRVRSMHALGHATTRTLNTCTQYMIQSRHDSAHDRIHMRASFVLRREPIPRPGRARARKTEGLRVPVGSKRRFR